MSHASSHVQYPVSLRRLFPLSSFVGCGDIRVANATERSSDCGADALFAAIPGTRLDGNRFIGDALKRGAGSLLVQHPQADVTVPQCVVPNVRRAYAELCSALAGWPSRRIGMTGVTGTNGKTTVTWLVRSILQAAGHTTGLLGTIEYHDGVASSSSVLTTPDPKTLSKYLQTMVANGATHAAIELSSHALDQERCAGTAVDVAIVTNVTQDHFDYHETYNAYLDAKAKIASHCKPGGRLVLNMDDAGSRSLLERDNGSLQVTTYGLQSSAEISAFVQHESLAGTRFVLNIRESRIDVFTPLVGRHNVSNCLAAAAAADHFGVGLEAIAAGIESLSLVPGRLERVECDQPYDVFVDYAHTDDALRRCVRCLKQMTRGRVICVFGAGGDRDRSKRPLLGNAAAEADLAIVTSDNPRSESPAKIIEDIIAGFPETSRRRPFVEADRSKAIRWALEHASQGDTVLIAGKGHETEQIIGTQKLPFDDREVVRSWLLEQAPSRDHDAIQIGA